MGIIELPPNVEGHPGERFEVLCGDGHIRHRDPFNWLADARSFAEHDHDCMTDQHTIRVKENDAHTDQ